MKTPPPDLNDLACACASARRVARVLTQFYDSRLRTSGMEAPQFSLMLALELAGASSQVDLGRRFAMDKTTVSRNLKLLERNRWIQAAPSGDKRVRRFQLTATGRKCLAAAKPEWEKAQEQLRAGMTAEHWNSMFEAFRIATKAAQSL